MYKLQLFVMWLDGFLDDKESLNEEQTKRVADRLNNLFEHEAGKESDDSEPPSSTQEKPPWELRPGNGGEKFRC